jgi:DNA-binding transcriptional MocR family regulator
MSRLEDKELLSLMELAEAPDMISFSGGFPSPETYPIQEIKESFVKVLDEAGKEALSYSSASGFTPLRETIAHRMNRLFGIKATKDEIIITGGSQQALDLSGMLFIDEGDVILFETPSYLGALNALKAYEAELVAVPTDKDGIEIAALKAAIDKYGDRIKLIYVIPDYQNPTSRCWSNQRRQEFIEFISDHEIAVLEDAAYAELAFGDSLKKPLISFDHKGQVVYCGTFSKTFCPGLRVAWIYAQKDIKEKYLLLKSSVDLSTSAIAQRQMDYYMNHCDYDGHIKKIVALYKSRRDTMMKAIADYFPDSVFYEVPEGGLFLWLSLPEGKNSRELLLLALKEKVAFVPGGSFYPENAKNNEMRINFSNMSDETIIKGMSILGRITTDYLR